ncbi:MAG TPA: NAD(P)H-hydrate dehydratase, partial [Acidimicrobiales bacterium]|nr:NAD(P)H-hydrate dehydratase [Acidimicrobiales bacterium]
LLDAGALSAALSARHPGTVLAPNPREAAELLGSDAEDEGLLATALTERVGRPVAVRGPSTIVAELGRAWRSPAPPSGLGTPGSGDVFVGTLAGLLATGVEVTAALGWAVELHAACGRRLAVHTPVGYLASDLVAELPCALAAAASAPDDRNG